MRKSRQRASIFLSIKRRKRAKFNQRKQYKKIGKCSCASIIVKTRSAYHAVIGKKLFPVFFDYLKTIFVLKKIMIRNNYIYNLQSFETSEDRFECVSASQRPVTAPVNHEQDVFRPIFV